MRCEGCLCGIRLCAHGLDNRSTGLASWNVDELGGVDAARILARCLYQSAGCCSPESTGARTAASVTLRGFGLRELVTLGSSDDSAWPPMS